MVQGLWEACECHPSSGLLSSSDFVLKKRIGVVFDVCDFACLRRISIVIYFIQVGGSEPNDVYNFVEEMNKWSGGH